MSQTKRLPSVNHRLSQLRAIVMIAFAGISGFGIALWSFENGRLDRYLSHLSWFELREVKIHSEWPLTVSTVRTYLPELQGKNLVTVRPRALIELLSSKPWVENVAIKKEYPDRLVIDIETKRPQAITLVHGQPSFLDGRGQVIEKVTPEMLRVLDLPFLSNESESTRWNVAKILDLLEPFKRAAGHDVTVSQVVLGTYPYFKIFLSHPKVEVLLNYENWESQTSILNLLLHSPPSQVGQLQRINLVFPKKAVVSSSLSH